MKYAIVLAAGKGTRMQSSKNKVMHSLLHKPIIGHVIDHLEEIDVEKTIVVTGYRSEEIKDYLKDRVEYATQDEQIGTGDAVAKVKQLESKVGSTLVLFGDSALIQASTLEKVMEKHEGNDLTIVTAQVKNPGRYSRVVRDTQGFVKKIVEAHEATDLETTINEINLGVYCFNNELLYKYLPEITDDTKDELNIIALVEIMTKNGHKIQALKIEDEQEFLGVNDRNELAYANSVLRDRINQQHLLSGVSILEPQSTYIGPNVIIDPDVTIYPNVHIYGKSHLKSGVTVYPNSWIEDSIIGENTCVDSSRITDSQIGSETTVGPYAHLRAHSDIGNHVRIGNFVEFKNTKVKDNTNAAHLSYLGDSEIGSKVNIGCGVVTINYDGKNKSKTIIGDNTFIGSQSGLIAPITVGDNVVVAAGSTVSGDIDDGDLAIARAKQENKRGYGQRYLKEKGKI